MEIPSVEADDTMGSLAKWAEKQDCLVYLCTSDKDLCQLVNETTFIINPWKDNLTLDAEKVEQTYGVKPSQIADLLAIMGDSSDNIPGLTGFGPKTAVALLKEFGTLENILQHPDKVPGKKKQETLIAEADVARLSKRLATIHTDIEFEKDLSFYTKKEAHSSALRAFYLEMGFTSLVKELDAAVELSEEAKVEKIHESTTYHLVDDLKSLETLIEKLQGAEEICFDIESTHLRPMLAEIVGVGFCIQTGVAYYIPTNGQLGKKVVLNKLKPLFENPQMVFYGHNVKYDCHILANEGIYISNLCFDTVLASYLLHPGNRRHTLDYLAFHYFEKVKTPIKNLIGSGQKEISMKEVPLDKVCQYCCEDVDYTYRVKHLLEKELKQRNLLPLLLELELPLTLVLFKMERFGIYLNIPKMESMSREVTQSIKEIEREIYDLAQEEFNISSPKQLSKILFEKMGIKSLKKTATGLSTSAEVLEILAKEYPIAEKILEYRTLEKLRSTYLDALPAEVNPRTERIHTTFNQSITATGRLACQDPNLQNIPIRTAAGKRIREAFSPSHKHWSFLSADYSQIELRLLAHLSGDENLIRAFNAGEDIHVYTASLVFDIPLEQVSATQRHQAKAINFGIIYGQQAYGLSQEIGVSVSQAGAFIEAYFERYPSVFSFIATCIETARATGKTVTMTGREREILDIHSKNTMLRLAAERLAINTPLQGSAADLIKKAMLDIDAQLLKKEMKSAMILQIHDELIFEAPDDEIEILHDLVKASMEGVFALKVPLIVDVNVGKNWGEC